MGAFGIWQWIIVLGVVVLLFARPGKISGLMGDFGKGLRSFKTGMKEDEADGEGDDIKVIAEEAPAPKAKKKRAAKKKTASVAAKKKPAKKAAMKKKPAKKAAKKKTAKKRAAKKTKTKA